ncbi:MAG TPA: ATP synthase subunit I [Burkholderiales bacterium]|nr:ATP synthase subunit I [Burkholderiales bacterium]
MTRGLLAVLGLQLLVLGVVVSGFLLVSGLAAAKSAALGGAIAIVPGAFYAWRLIASRKAPHERMLRVHVGAEAGKLTLTFVMFAATFVWIRDVSVIPLFAAYIAILMAYWLALIVFKRI